MSVALHAGQFEAREQHGLVRQLVLDTAQDRAVVLKEGLRIIGFFDKWPDPDKLKYIRDEFVRVMRDPRNAPDPDWTVLAF